MRFYRSLLILLVSMVIAAAVSVTAYADDAAEPAAAEDTRESAGSGDISDPSEGMELPDTAETYVQDDTAESGVTYYEEEPDNYEDDGCDYTAEYLAAKNALNADQTEVKTTSIRQQVVDYAVSFVGGRYVWGGTDPHSGVDCSGFTAYILGNVAGIALPHSSRAQAGMGTSIGYEALQPGDLVFYSGSGRIDHVAIYIGDGLVVHASTARTGIKISALFHRPVTRYVNLLG